MATRTWLPGWTEHRANRSGSGIELRDEKLTGERFPDACRSIASSSDYEAPIGTPPGVEHTGLMLQHSQFTAHDCIPDFRSSVVARRKHEP